MILWMLCGLGQLLGLAWPCCSGSLDVSEMMIHLPKNGYLQICQEEKESLISDRVDKVFKVYDINEIFVSQPQHKR